MVTMIGDLQRYGQRARMVALGAARFRCPTSSRRPGSRSTRGSLLRLHHDASSSSTARRRDQVYASVFEVQGWDSRSTDRDETGPGDERACGAGRRAGSASASSPQNTYPKLWKAFENYFPMVRELRRGRHDLLEEIARQDIHGDALHSNGSRRPTGNTTPTYGSQQPVWREYLGDHPDPDRCRVAGVEPRRG